MRALSGDGMPRLSGLIAMVLAAAWAGPGQAADWIKVCYEDWEPYSDPDRRGIAIDVFNQAMSDGDHVVRYDMTAYKRCMVDTVRGKYDAILAASAYDKEIQGLAISKVSYMIWAIAFFVRENDPAQHFESLDQFKGRRVGLIEGYQYPDEIQTYDLWARETISDGRIGLKMIEAGRIDTLLEDAVQLLTYIRQRKLKVRMLAPMAFPDTQYAVFRNPAWAARYDVAVGRMLADGTIDAIYKRHVGMTFSDLLRMADGKSGEAPAADTPPASPAAPAAPPAGTAPQKAP